MPDANTVAKMVLNDWQRGKIPYFVKPSGVSVHGPLVVGQGRGATWVWLGVYYFTDVSLDCNQPDPI